MKSPWIEGLRSVAMTVPDIAAARAFYVDTWRLREVSVNEAQKKAHGGSPISLYLAGSGTDHHLLSLHEAPGVPMILKVTLRARSQQALHDVVAATRRAGGVIERDVSLADGPAGGAAIVIRDPDGRRYEVVHGDVRSTLTQPIPKDQPVRLAHAVLNSHAVESSRAFLEQALGFVMSDRTRIMAFMNCNDDHHSLALGDTDNDALNHIAFLMPTLDAVMRGGGRMRDAGMPAQWGPGRHGPGDNAFNYFIDPFGIVVEYTAEVEQIDDSYRVGMPTDWTWPPGRIDQWGVGQAPTDALKQAQRRVMFAPAALG